MCSDLPQPLSACILSGGRSRRFGSDKARARLDGQPLLKRVADDLQSVAGSVTVVAERADKYADLGLRTIADDRPHLGPVGGLLTALGHVRRGWVVLCSCDLLGLDVRWIDRLLAGRSPDVLAVCFRDAGRWQPFPGLYHADLQPRVEAFLEQGGRSMQALLADCPVAAVTLPDNWPAVAQANTPADLARHRDGRS